MVIYTIDLSNVLPSVNFHDFFLHLIYLFAGVEKKIPFSSYSSRKFSNGNGSEINQIMRMKYYDTKFISQYYISKHKMI